MSNETDKCGWPETVSDLKELTTMVSADLRKTTLQDLKASILPVLMYLLLLSVMLVGFLWHIQFLEAWLIEGTEYFNAGKELEFPVPLPFYGMSMAAETFGLVYAVLAAWAIFASSESLFRDTDGRMRGVFFVLPLPLIATAYAYYSQDSLFEQSGAGVSFGFYLLLTYLIPIVPYCIHLKKRSNDDGA